MDETNGITAAPGDAVSADDVANPSVAASGRKVSFVASLPKLDKQYNGIGVMEQQAKSPIVTCVFEDDVRQRSFLQHFSLTVMWILWFSYYPLKFTGFLIEYTLNFLSHNGGLLGLLYRVFILEWGKPALLTLPLSTLFSTTVMVQLKIVFSNFPDIQRPSKTNKYIVFGSEKKKV